nr:hypothetical protein [uncultured Ruegeria sp.]
MLSQHHRLCLVVCRQGGKSVSVGAKAGYEAHIHHGLRVVAVAPSFRQASLLTDKIQQALLNHGIWCKRVKERLTLANGSWVQVLGGDRPDTLRGYTADLVLIDEIGFLRAGGADLIAAVMPMIAQSRGKLIAISSPNGPSGFLFDFFHQGGVEAMRVKASEISHFDQSVIEEIRGRLGPALASQELDAQFVSSSRSVFDADALAAAFDAPAGLVGDSDDVAEAESDLEKRFAQMQKQEQGRGLLGAFGV